MIALIIVWWHEKVLGHNLQRARVSVPMFDAFSRGELVKDKTCGKVWAL